MDLIKDDILNTKYVLDGCDTDKYSKVYFESNENLNNLFGSFDFGKKSCLSILSSGDQVFHLLNKGIDNVDLLDKNKLTIYYFYLRLWTIKYLNMYYPPRNINCTFIKNLLNIVDVKTKKEREAFKYWNLFVSNYSKKDISVLFIMNQNVIDNSLPTNNINKIINRDYTFYNNDIKDKIYSDKKYDFIYLSNLLEWIVKDKDEMIPIRNNLYDLLKDDGFVICSNLCRNGNNGIGALIFEEYFNCYDIPNFDSFGENKFPGYVYIKK